jgi:hypothetical protein
MSKRLYQWSVLCVFALFWACTPEEKTEIKSVLINTDLYMAGSKESFSIQATKQMGNVLEITFSYLGGCVEQEPELVWGRGRGNSIPLTLPLKLMVSKADDCFCVMTKTRRFNIKALFENVPEEELALMIEGQSWGSFLVRRP